MSNEGPQIPVVPVDKRGGSAPGGKSQKMKNRVAQNKKKRSDRGEAQKRAKCISQNRRGEREANQRRANSDLKL